MRPDPEYRQAQGESARIIHLGEVRRRKGRDRQAPDRYYLAAIVAVGILAWLLWGAVLLTLAPSRLLTYVAFFAPLAVAVAATGSVVAFLAERHLGYIPRLGVALRRGVLAAAVGVVNLAALAAHKWLLVIGGVTLIGAVVVDIAVERRENI